MEFVSVIFEDNLWLVFMMWKTWFIKKVKLFSQLLREKFDDLSVFINNFFCPIPHMSLWTSWSSLLGMAGL